MRDRWRQTIEVFECVWPEIWKELQLWGISFLFWFFGILVCIVLRGLEGLVLEYFDSYLAALLVMPAMSLAKLTRKALSCRRERQRQKQRLQYPWK